MKIGLLIIGSEVLSGKISDSNTKLLADFLKPTNLELNETITVKDDETSIHQGVRNLLERNDILITSGGLGPTRDDITKEALASYLGRKILYSPEAYEVAKNNYKKFDRPFPGKENGYCFLPEGFTALNNSSGLAPGFFAEHSGKYIFSGPGVPREFKNLLEEHFMKLISKKLNQDFILDTVLIRTKKIPEERIFGDVDPELWNKLAVYGEVSSLPILMGVDIGVKIKAKNQDEMARKVAGVHKVINDSPIKSAVWHYGYESLEEKIVVLANQKKIRFSFAESATGGLCSHRITNISGSSHTFLGSIICYDEKIKEHFLGVNPETLERCSAVSLECAEEMAEGLRDVFNVDIAISVTGFAGPGGGNDDFPVGSVCIGRSTKGGTSADSFIFKGDREILKQRFAQAALHTLLEELEKFA